MTDKTCRVSFSKEGFSVPVSQGTSLLEAIEKAGLFIETPCNGNGTCGKCKVKAKGSLNSISKSEQEKLEVTDDSNIICYGSKGLPSFGTYIFLFPPCLRP